MISENIKYYRQKIGYSQEKLAEKIDVRISDIANWELGLAEPSIKQVTVLSKALKISVDDLLIERDIFDTIITDNVKNTSAFNYEKNKGFSNKKATTEGFNNIGANLNETIKSILDRDESILWQGKPANRSNMMPNPIFMIIFGIIFFSIALFIFTMSLEASPIFSIFSLGFIVLASFIFITPFTVSKNMMVNTAYLVTDKRVIIVMGGKRISVTSYKFEELNTPNLIINNNGTGSVVFREYNYVGYNGFHHNSVHHSGFHHHGHHGFHNNLYTYKVQSAFFNIENPKSVYELINERINLKNNNN